MSTTGNEFEQPGVNQPDRGDAAGAEDTPGTAEPTRDRGAEVPPTSGAHLDEPAAAPDEPSHQAVGIGVIDDPEHPDHHGQDEGRDTMSAGQAQRRPGGLGTEQEQRLPAMSQNDASALEKVTGIVAQTRADVGTEPVDRIADVLHQRLDQAGVDLPDGDVDELARQISTGDAAGPGAP